MALAYPIDMPATGYRISPLGEIISNTDPVRVEMRLIENQLVAQGVGGQFSALRRPGSRWAGRMELPKLRDDLSRREWISFLTALRGTSGRFNLVDRGWRSQLGVGLSLAGITSEIKDAETIEMQEVVQEAIAAREFWATLATGDANVEGLVAYYTGAALEDANNVNVDLDLASADNRALVAGLGFGAQVYYALFRFVARPNGFMQFRFENVSQGFLDVDSDDTRSIVFRITAPNGAQFSGIVRLSDDETGVPPSVPYRFTTNGGAGAVFDAAVAWAQANAASLRGGGMLDFALVENTSPWTQDGNEVKDVGQQEIARPLDSALLNPGHWFMLNDRLRMVLFRNDGADKTTINFAPEVKQGEIGQVLAGKVSVEPQDLKIVARLTDNRGWSRDLLEHTSIDLPWEEFVV